VALPGEMMRRRDFIAMAASLGASLAWRSARARSSKTGWRERRELYPQGVASGDPHPDSVILWTRRPPSPDGEARKLTLEVAQDENFAQVVASADVSLTAETDWTCRVLAAELRPRQVYFYRFTDEQGWGSRVGRTITAPSFEDTRAVRFTFVSCQNVQHGASTAYRRMIWEDARKPAAEQLSFVLHLGDFIYEIVWYPEDSPRRYARRTRDVVRYPNGEKIGDFHVPTTVEDYRAAYRGYLLDPDLQDARARWPFVSMWDNHEFSWKCWQTQQNFGDGARPAQTRKVAANQAWFEYQPARVDKPGDPGIERYKPPVVVDKALEKFDDHGLGLEAGNIAAINSLRPYRTMRWGRNVELILTDNRTFRSEPVMERTDAAVFETKGFPFVVSQHVMEVLDAGRAYNNGQPAETIRFNGVDVPNPRRHSPPQSMLGAEEKAWFLQRLRVSRAPWKLWGNTVAMLDWRIDFQNLPPEIEPRWPTTGYAQFIEDDWSGYRTERAEILEVIRKEKIACVATLGGDRHAFLAGVLSASLPPQSFEPVAPEFITGSISAPGLFEAAEYSLPENHPLRAVYLYKPASGGPVQPAMNFAAMHGVRASLALQRTGDVQQALKERNPEVAPHLSFADAGGHGYAVVCARADELEVEFVCIPRPLERLDVEAGGPLAYRVVHRVKRWAPGEAPKLERTAVEGTLPLAL
jgi:alkaline phosphatase D